MADQSSLAHVSRNLSGESLVLVYERGFDHAAQ